MQLEGDLSELVKREDDHLDSILAIVHTIGTRSFAVKLM
ncbi:hypothetical protein Ga0466249_001285 [Sporomusaceae bacterium BoRhaA]|nr:hypothetical protein [Pelorhabdus rhamnosifermentans]MBU2700193.1 hypothetical protein [Pelorhabdus rhamnosifermentans]